MAERILGLAGGIALTAALGVVARPISISAQTFYTDVDGQVQSASWDPGAPTSSNAIYPVDPPGATQPVVLTSDPKNVGDIQTGRW